MSERISGWLTYFRLQGKRILRLLPAILLIGVIFLGAVLLVGRSFFISDSAGDFRKSIEIGVTGDTDDPMISMALSALRNLDTSRFAISLKTMTEAEAAAALRRGELQAYLIIPEDFYDSVNYYRNDVQIVYVSTDGAVGIGTVLINEIAQAVGSLLLESENAVYGMQSCVFDRLGDQYTPAQIGNLGEQMTAQYAIAIFGRESMYEVHETGLSDSLSFRGYYVCAFVLLFLLLIAIPFHPLHTDRDDSLSRLLRLRGISCFGQVFAEYLAFVFTVMILMIPALAGAGLLLRASGFSIPEFASSPVQGMLSLFPACCAAILVTGGLQFFLYELFTGAVSGILMQVLAALSGAYISGCFYPISYFPAKMQTVSDLLPAGTARLLLENRALGSYDAGIFLRALLWTVLFLFLSSAARRLKHSLPGRSGAERRRAA